MNLISLFWWKFGHAIYPPLSTYLQAMFSFMLRLMWIFMVVLVYMKATKWKMCVYIYIYLSITNHVIVFNVKQKVFLPDLLITLYQLLSVEFIGTPTKTPHFVKDLDRSLENISNDITAILTGDLNIDIIKVENEITLEYVSTLMSYGYLPYKTLPSRLTEYSAICIDHIFMKYARNSRLQPTNT